ncbi:MAG: crosslink repair DNA glycosylase YcaQ family protein [Nocardioidaceae bacterium]
MPAWPDAAAELAIGARRTDGKSGDATRALAAGKVVKVFAFRGATHLMTPRDAGAYLALRASSRMWELPSWESFYGLAPSDWPRFREYVRRALADGPLTRSELAAALGRSSRYRHLRTIVAEGNDTLLKPLTWQGDMGLGPVRDGETTFLRLDDVPGWAGIPDIDEAGPTVVAAYFRTYGPATPDRVHDWFGKGLGAKRQAITRWLDQLDEQLRAGHDRRRPRPSAPGGPRRPADDAGLHRRPATAGPRSLGDGSRQLRHPRRASRPPRSREPVGQSGGLPWRCGRHVDAARRAPGHRMVQGVRSSAAHRPRPGGRGPGEAPGPSARRCDDSRLTPRRDDRCALRQAQASNHPIPAAPSADAAV